MPSWLELDSDAKTVYCTDEGGAQGGSTLTALSVADNGTLKVSETVKSPGGEVHAGWYGGADDKGFIAVADW